MNKSGEEIYNELKEGLIKPFIFYLPFNILPEDAKAIISENSLLKSAFNIIISITKDFDFHIDQKNLKDIEFINKSEHLDYLLIKLLELKEKTSPTLFDFIFNKYYNMVFGLEFVSNWMLTNFDNYFEKDHQKKVFFKFQAHAFKTHIENLNSKIKYNYSSIKPVPDLASYFKNEFTNLNVNTTATNTAAATALENKSSKKDKHITAATARSYLLETVFNVKVEELI